MSDTSHTLPPQQASPFSRAIYPWECSHWSEADADLAKGYLAESRISDLATRAAQVQLGGVDFLARISARAAFTTEDSKPSWWRWLTAANDAQLKQSLSYGLSDSAFALLGLFEPEIAYALSELQREFSAEFGAQAPHLVSLCAPGLLKRIWRLAHPALLLELKLARQQGQLKSTTPTRRFIEFCAQISNSGRGAVQALYPLLWRDIASFCISHQSRRRELFADIERHADELSARFGFTVSLARLSFIKSEVADLHNSGRSTLLLHFGAQASCNEKDQFTPSKLRGDSSTPEICVYKPRNLKIESSFLDFYKATLKSFGRAIETPKFVHGRHEGREYGFMQYVVHRSLGIGENPAEYAWRLGALLAIGEALLGNDFHYENIIADAVTPMPIDVETLFQPFMRAEVGGELPGDLMRLTPFRVGLLPRMHSGSATEFSPFFANEGRIYTATDLVDIGTDSMRLESFERRRDGRDLHLPRSATGVHSLLAERHAFEQGWTKIRHHISQQWAELIQPNGAIAAMSEFPIRLIARATQHYHMIATAICAPRYLQCTAKRLALIDRLWQGFVPAHQDGKRFQSEVEALTRNEIPYFFGMPRERYLKAEQVSIERPGEQMCVADAFPETAWHQVRTLGASAFADFERSRAALRTAFVVSLEHDHRLRKLPIQATALRTGKSRRVGWHKVLRNVADLLALRQYQDHQQTGWLKFEASKDGFTIRFSSLDLYSGLAGIGLSFARLAASKFGYARDLEIANQCFASIAFRLQSNHLALTQIGFAGAGGVLYGASMAAALLPSSAIANLAVIEKHCLNFLQCARTAPKLIEEMDVISGGAGALLGVCAAWQNSINGDRTALQEEIRAWVNLILKRAQPSPQGQPGLAWQSTSYPTMLTGMAHGASGIALALHNAEECLQASNAVSLKVQRAAMRFETSFIQQPSARWRDARFGVVADADECCMAWCHGAPGLLMARLVVPDSSLDTDAFSAQLERVIAEGFEQDWVLCHGALGQLMILRRMMKEGRTSAERFAALESAVLDAWERAWPVLIEQAVQPGLFDGLAGAMFCALDMLDVCPDLDLLGFATKLERHDTASSVKSFDQP